jgi:hypothetical protein
LENRRRLIDRAGQLMFTMTPLLGLSWTYDEIWSKRDTDGVTVVQWSMLDNPHLPAEEVQIEIRACSSEKERQAVINGDFVHFRGRVLEEFEEGRHVVPRPSPADLVGMEVIIGYDPGLSRSGVVWCAFDADNHLLIFDELYPQGESVQEIVKQARARNAWWGVKPLFWVIDPSSRIRDMASARESVQSALLRENVSVIPGQNDRMAGILELKRRLANDALKVSENCTSWLREADRWLVAMDEEAAEMRAKGTAKGATFTTIGPDHLMDPTRYVAMSRVWVTRLPDSTPVTERRFRPNEAIPARYLNPRTEAAPMGFMS